MTTEPTIYVFDPEKMRTHRTSAKMTITSLAVKVGVSRVSTSLWESGTTEPSFEHMQQLAHAFGLEGIVELLKVKTNV